MTTEYNIMNPELDKALCEAYPKIFVNRHGDKTTTAMCWGFSHSDGWYNIIDTMCNTIQSRIDGRNKYNKWAVENNRLTQEEIPQVVAVQVKEKFGTLRFYYDGGDPYIAGIVDMAESMSACTCEECGSPGKIRGDSWVRTLCDKHYVDPYKPDHVEHHPV